MITGNSLLSVGPIDMVTSEKKKRFCSPESYLKLLQEQWDHPMAKKHIAVPASQSSSILHLPEMIWSGLPSFTKRLFSMVKLRSDRTSDTLERLHEAETHIIHNTAATEKNCCNAMLPRYVISRESASVHCQDGLLTTGRNVVDKHKDLNMEKEYLSLRNRCVIRHSQDVAYFGACL